ncbi:MAG: polysaccharide lyase family 7 protein, partial [Pseudonocardia sp.]
DGPKRSMGHWFVVPLTAATVPTTSVGVSGADRPDTTTDTAIAAGTSPTGTADRAPRTEPGTPPGPVSRAPSGTEAGSASHSRPGRAPGAEPGTAADPASRSGNDTDGGRSSLARTGPTTGPTTGRTAGPTAGRTAGPTAGPGSVPHAGSQIGTRHRAADCRRPSELLDLGNWKLTLPTGAKGGPTEILGQQLGSFASDDWFNVGRGCEAVAFRAPVNGVTTSGSKNPRSELREMTAGGTGNAGWSSTSGTHTMTLTEAFTRLPEGKPHVVGGQIHDASDDITVFRLEGTNLYVTNGNDPHYQLVTGNYVLGTPFEAKFVVSGGQVRAFYNGHLVATIAKAFDGAYFKAGAYTQANCANAAPCDSGNYGEVLIYDLQVTHR